MYSIRVDPEHDTPDVLRSYAQGYGVKRGWWFLTGTKADLERLRVAFGDDPSLERSRSNHLNLIRFGIEPLERWAVCPAWMTPKAIPGVSLLD
jgi:protein SCO1/2